MRGLPLNTSVNSSLLFFAVLQLLCASGTLLIVFGVIGFIFVGNLGNAGGQSVVAAIAVPLIFVGGWVLAQILSALLWALMTHFTLRLTGGCAQSFGRTFQAILFSSGTLAMTAVPCVGIYCLSYAGLVWWVVSAAFMVIAGQRVSGLRGTLATVWPPLLMVLIVMGLYLYALFGAMNTATMGLAGGNFGAMPSVMAQQTLPQLQRALRVSSDVNQVLPNSVMDIDLTTPPDAAANRQALANAINGGDLMRDVVPFVDGFDFMSQMDDGLNSTLQDLRKSAVQGKDYERLGGLVYCMPSSALATSELWLLVVVVPADPIMETDVALSVALVGGETIVISKDEITDALQKQDALRAQDGLGPIDQAVRDAIGSLAADPPKSGP